MLPRNVIYYGTDEPLPERQDLRAGPLTMIYEAGDLRYIRLGNHEIIRRLYVAVRDRNWGTVAPVLSNIQIVAGTDSFSISYDAENKQDEIDFFWRGTITGDTTGTITFSMDGIARSTFLRNRIGFCILHPAECAGSPCLVETVDGAQVKGNFPQYISPHQPFKDMRAIAHEVTDGVWAEVRFEGDIFEMEDQRNWTDASYKTYSTPLSLPYPVEITQGTQIRQAVTISLTPEGTLPATSPESNDPEQVIVTLQDASRATRLPQIGLGIAAHEQPLGEREVERLKALHLAHLRLDLHLSNPAYQASLRRASAEASSTVVPLEIALFLTGNAAQELEGLAQELQQSKPNICRWLIFHEDEVSTSERWVALAREHLKDYTGNAPIGAGTNAYFTELNRNCPPVQSLDFVSYSMNPQVHAFDNSSLTETLKTQATTIESARRFSGELPLVISPITLKPRFNPNATGTEREPAPGELPPQVDVRQMSLFGAGWTAGSIKYIAESGASSITYYETTGWRGVMETEAGSPEPELFRSIPGSVFPLYHVLADVGEFAGGEVLPLTSSDILKVDGLALRKDGKTRLILANMTPEPQPVTIQFIGEHATLRQLDETNAEEAMRSPETYRAQSGQPLHAHANALEITLRAYAIATIDM